MLPAALLGIRFCLRAKIKSSAKLESGVQERVRDPGDGSVAWIEASYSKVEVHTQGNSDDDFL